jgi:hypothetical protein
MAQEDVDRLYREIMALNDEEKLEFGKRYLELLKEDGSPTESIELWIERLRLQQEAT